MNYGYDHPRGVHPIRMGLLMPVGTVRVSLARLKCRGVVRATARPWQDALPRKAPIKPHLGTTYWALYLPTDRDRENPFGTAYASVNGAA
jgi:hypothetical protein